MPVRRRHMDIRKSQAAPAHGISPAPAMQTAEYGGDATMRPGARSVGWSRPFLCHTTHPAAPWKRKMPLLGGALTWYTLLFLVCVFI